jgi:hypothetical protein
MEFDPSFPLLKKFTIDRRDLVSGSDAITEQDVISVAEYLGIELPATTSLLGRINILKSELSSQNQFLTLHLHGADIDISDLYHRSGFVRCLIPSFDGAFLSHDSKDALWDKFYTAAPPRQRRPVERYNIVKRA